MTLYNPAISVQENKPFKLLTSWRYLIVVVWFLHITYDQSVPQQWRSNNKTEGLSLLEQTVQGLLCSGRGGERRERHPQANLPSILTLSIHIKLRFLVPRKLEIVNTEGEGISFTIHTWNFHTILGVFRYRLYPE